MPISSYTSAIIFRFHLHLIPYPFPYRKVNVLALLSILLGSLYPLVLYLLSILALFPIFLLFPLQRQCRMPYLTLVGGKLWNWKRRPCIILAHGSLFHYRMLRRLLVANRYTWLCLIMMVLLNDCKLVWGLRIIHKHMVLIMMRHFL
jgi:hypothetical protein